MRISKIWSIPPLSSSTRSIRRASSERGRTSRLDAISGARRCGRISSRRRQRRDDWPPGGSDRSLPYEIRYHPTLQKVLARLDATTHRRILEAIHTLKENPYRGKKLQ